MAKTRNMFSSGGIHRKFRLEHLETRQLLAATLPLLPAIIAPASNPALPSGFDIFSPVASTGTPPAGSPGIAQWTQSGNPNDTIAISLTNPTALPAADNSSDTQFFTFGQTAASNGALVSDTIEQLGGGLASVNLGSANTPNSMYLLWAENADGYSSAVAVNKADAWWVGPNQASSGQTVSVYGQNLTFSPTDGLSWVYITQAGRSTGQWATVTSANPYQVSFVVPVGLAAGNYQVWVHNGHGGEYGWSSPTTLSVVAAAAANGPVFNVLNYGAIGNGVTDSTAAFQAALNAASQYPGATVYAPAGNYMVTQIFMHANILLIGDGAGKTNILEITPAANSTARNTMFSPSSNSEVENLTLNANNAAMADVMYGRFLTNMKFSGVTFENNLTDDIDIHGDQLVTFENCNFIGYSNFLGTASQAFFNQCNFYAVNDAEEMLFSWGGNDISITNCTVQDLNDSNPNSGAGWGAGRFFVGNDIWGNQTDTYIANNTTTFMGVRPTDSNQNAGEQLLWEPGALVSGGVYVSSTANTVTYTGLPSTVTAGYDAIVVAGDGVGEYVPISSYNPTTGVITLAGTWAATPDSTSVVRVGFIVDNIAVYDNSLQGKGVTNTASTGVQFWGGAIDCIVDSNTISNVTHGILFAAQNSAGNVIPSYFNLIENNTITNTEYAIEVWASGVPGQIGNAGSVVRFNQISLASLTAIYMNAQLSPVYLIVEGNDATGAPVGMDLANPLTVPDNQTAPTFLTLSDNTFSLGSAVAAGSMGIDDSEIVMLTQDGNTFAGFAQTYGGSISPTTLPPLAAAPSTQIPSTTALNGNTTSKKPKFKRKNKTANTTDATETSATATSTIATSATLTFAAVTTTTTNNLKISSATLKNDAAILAA